MHPHPVLMILMLLTCAPVVEEHGLEGVLVGQPVPVHGGHTFAQERFTSKWNNELTG